MLRALVPFSLAVVAVLAGCSSGSEDAPGSEAPATEKVSQGFCAAAADLPSRCAGAKPTTCDEQITTTCSSMTGVLNASLLDAAGTCLSNAECGTSPTKCLADALKSAKPTDAHRALAKAYCTSCAAVPGDACEKAFFSTEGDGTALAEILLPVGDEIAKKVTETCVTFTCRATFLTCAQGIVAKELASSLTPDAAQCLLKSVAGSTSGTSDTSNPDQPSTPSDPPANPPPSGDDGGATPPPPSGSTTVDLTIVDVTVPSTKANGSAWDIGGGKPDPFVFVNLPNAKKTSVKSDTTTPSYNEIVATNVSEGMLASVAVQAYDSDVVVDDWIGNCTARLDATPGDHTFTCTASASVNGPGFTMHYRVALHP